MKLATGKKMLQFQSNTYLQFGQLKKITENDGYLNLHNEEGIVTSKSKKYLSWQRTKEKAEQHLDRWIVIRTGPGWSPWEWFSDLFGDYNMLDTPEDTGRDGQEMIVMTRIARYRINEQYNLFREKMDNETAHQKQEREEIIRRYEEEREQLTPSQKAEIDDAVDAVDQNWMEFVQNPERTFVITGAAFNNGKAGHVDKSFALRYGIDVTMRKRMQVRVIERLHKNYVGVELMDYNDLYCRVALKISNHRDTNGQWVIASADATDNNHYKHERKLAPAGGKDVTKPISWFLQTHKEIQKQL